MKTGTMARIAARSARKSVFLAPLFAAMLLTGGAMAEEQPEDLLLTDGEDLAALDSEALDENSGGFAVQVSNVDQQTTFSDNPVTVDNGGQINTGGILSSNANTGGITTTMLNTGNNVSFQNSTTLNIYLDAAQ